MRSFMTALVMVGILGIFGGFFLGAVALELLGVFLILVGIVGYVALRNF